MHSNVESVPVRAALNYRWIILILVLPVAITTTAVWVSPASLLTTIQQSLHIDIGRAGTLVTLITLISGIFMFSGSLAIDHLGLRVATVTAMTLLTIGAGLSYFTTSYPGIFGARLLVGIGIGLCTPLPGALTMAWFPRREQPYVNSLNALVGYVGISIAVVGAVPLLHRLGHWQSALSAYAAIPLLAAVGWLILGRNPPLAAVRLKPLEPVAKRQSGIRLAARRPEVWLLTAAMLGQMWAFNTFSTFLPAFLETARGLSRVEAGAVSGLLPAAGLFGAILCGVGTGILGRRKPFMWPIMAIGLVAALLVVNLPMGPVVYGSIAAFGFASAGLNPPLTTVVMDLHGATAEMSGGAFALIYGISFTVSFFVSPFFGALSAAWGIPLTMTIFSLPQLLSVVALLIIPETGPNGRRA